jgi:hypothetical protein
MFLFTRAQTERIKKRTLELLLEQAEIEDRQASHPTVEHFYEKFQPIWEEMVGKSAKVILHRSELFPILARPDVVRRRFNFTPAWVGAYLRIHGYHWVASSELEREIQAILALAPSKKAKR